MFRGMLTQRCTLWRLTETLDEFNTPIGNDWAVVETSPCRLSRKSIQAVQDAPDNRTQETYMLYLPTQSSVAAGDIAAIEGVGKYRVSKPYRPNGHHTECQVEWEGPL